MLDQINDKVDQEVYSAAEAMVSRMTNGLTCLQIHLHDDMVATIDKVPSHDLLLSKFGLQTQVPVLLISHHPNPPQEQLLVGIPIRPSIHNSLSECSNRLIHRNSLLLVSLEPTQNVLLGDHTRERRDILRCRRWGKRTGLLVFFRSGRCIGGWSRNGR